MSKNKHEKHPDENFEKNEARAEDKIEETQSEPEAEKAENAEAEKGKQPSESETLRAKLAESEKKAEEYKQSWYRSAAEFDNYKKRHANERAQAYADGQGDVIKSILVIGDNLDRALASTADEKTADGLKIMIRQFYETLANLNVKVVDPIGEKFDPNLHEAVHQVEAEDGEESGIIKSVFRKGYELNGKILRYAQVVVIK